LKEVVRFGLVDPSWTVVLLNTGSGLKDVGSAMKVAGQPTIISPEPAALEALYA